MERKLILKFLLWTALISAGPWCVGIFAPIENRGLLWALLILGCLGPAAASFIVTRSSGIVKSLGHWVQTGLSFRLPPIAWILPLGGFAIYAVTLAAFGIFPDKSFGLSLLIAFLTLGLGELGWRHVLQSLASIRMGFLLSAGATGLVWLLWSLPLRAFDMGWMADAQVYMIIAFYVGAALTLGAIRHITRATLPCLIYATLVGSFVFSGAPSLASTMANDLLALVIATWVPAIIGWVLVSINKSHPLVPLAEPQIKTKKRKKNR